MAVNFNKLKNIKNSVSKAPELQENNRFNFGIFKGVTFEKAIIKPTFRRWVYYMYSISDEWSDKIERDMKNFDRFLPSYLDDDEYHKLETTAERLEFIYKDDQEDEVCFWFGKYKKLSLDKVPKDYKIWWADQILKNHPTDDINWWSSPEGLKTYRLLSVLDL